MKQIWLWNWTSGGYNWTRCDSREEALEAARKMTSGNTLQVDESTLRKATEDDVNREERKVRSLFW